MTGAETPKYDVDTQKQKDKDNNTLDKDLKKEVEKKDNNNISEALKLMTTKEIDIVKKDFSPDEKNNIEYNDKFNQVQKEFKTEIQNIPKESTPEEKTKALEFAFEKFQAKIWEIKGTKEAMDAKIAQYNKERMEKSEKKNEQLSQKFKKDLLDMSQEAVEKKLQVQKLAAEKLWNKEQKSAQEEAKDSIQSTSAFGPPGNLEKGNSKV